MKKYKVIRFFAMLKKDIKGNDVLARDIEVVKTDITWQEAKKMRKEDKYLQIVPVG